MISSVLPTRHDHIHIQPAIELTGDEDCREITGRLTMNDVTKICFLERQTEQRTGDHPGWRAEAWAGIDGHTTPLASDFNVDCLWRRTWARSN